eukprot:171793-Rhodomonas_salina.3
MEVVGQGMVVVLLVTAYLIQRNCYREDEPAQDRYDSPYGPQPVSPSHGGVVIDASLGYDYQAGSRQQSGFSGCVSLLLFSRACGFCSRERLFCATCSAPNSKEGRCSARVGRALTGCARFRRLFASKRHA